MKETLYEKDLRNLYQELILDHGKNPRNFRAIKKFNRESIGHNPLCGDKLVLFLYVSENDVIQDIAFQGTGCAISIASASIMTEMLKGRTLVESEELFLHVHAICTGVSSIKNEMIDPEDNDRLDALSGVRNYPMRVKCATLAWHTLHAAIKDEKKVSTE